MEAKFLPDYIEKLETLDNFDGDDLIDALNMLKREDKTTCTDPAMFSETHYDLLLACGIKNSPEEWNDYVKSKMIRPMLKGAILSFQHEKFSLSGFNLHGANLVEANLQNINVEKAILADVDARNANLTGTIVENAIWHNANLTGAILSDDQKMILLSRGAIVDATQEQKLKVEKAKLEADKQKLEADRKTFEIEKTEFDNRAATHARRDLLGKMKAVIDNKTVFELSKKTLQKRKIINKLLVIILVVSALGAIGMGSLAIFKEFTIYAIPASSLLILFISTAIYFLRWHQQWFKIHADAELDNKKFEIDILRASWLAELYFEWKESKKDNESKDTEFPQQMIDSFTKNIFEYNNNTKHINHPIEDLLKMSKKFTKIKCSRDGFEINQDSPPATK